MAQTIGIGGVRVGPGEIGFGRLLLEPLPDGAEVFIPLMVLNGVRDGPVLWMGSDIHGNEIPGIEVTRRIVREIVDPQELSGAIIGATVLNPYAFRTRQGYAPMDSVNLNAVFPGDPLGTVSERAAHVIFAQGISQCDYAIDFHAATVVGMEFMCLPVCADGEIMQRSLDIALAFGFPLVELTRDMYGYDRSLIAWAQDTGKPGFVCEVRAQGMYVESSVRAGVRGVLNVMKHIGMLEGEVEPQAGIVGSGGTYRLFNVRTRKSGLVHFRVTGGDWVEPGDEIGVVRDPYGEVVDELAARTRGWVRSMVLNRVVYAGQIVCTLLEPHPKEKLWKRLTKS